MTVTACAAGATGSASSASGVQLTGARPPRGSRRQATEVKGTVHLYFDAEDTPVELAVSYFDPERYSYRVKLRRRAR